MAGHDEVGREGVVRVAVQVVVEQRRLRVCGVHVVLPLQAAVVQADVVEPAPRPACFRHPLCTMHADIPSLHPPSHLQEWYR